MALCSRAVLSSNISSDGVSNSEQSAGILPARYTILAMSKQVVTYEFKKEYIVYIPGPLKAVFLNGIKGGFDWDVCPRFNPSVLATEED